MNRTILVVLAIAVFGGIAYFGSQANTTEVYNDTATSTNSVVQEVALPDWADDEEAVQAAKDVIRKKELQAELEAVTVEITDLEERKAAIEKELGLYWKSKSNVRALIREHFPEDPQTAIAIAFCESGLNPNAYNGSNYDGSTDGGLWQINSVHDKRLQQLGLDKYDPEDATKFARMLYDERKGYGDWVCYNKQMHVAYLR